jgi:serine phosphatase RsbU (regulator of sigma subunit)
MATVTLLAAGVNRIVARQQRHVVTARNVAEAVQRAVVPEPPARVGPFRVACRYRASQRGALIGGDLYAARETRHGVRLLVGDVRGKGLGATESVAVLLGAFREAADDAPDLQRLTARLEAALLRERRPGRTELDPLEGFITAVVAEIPDEPPPRLRTLIRGHPPPLLVDSSGGVRRLDAPEPALPLGLDDLRACAAVGEGELRPTGGEWVRTVPFPPGAHLLLYTDGLSEARDARRAFYDPATGLATVLRGRRYAGPEELLDRLLADVMAHTRGGLDDDMALLAVHHPVAGG